MRRYVILVCVIFLGLLYWFAGFDPSGSNGAGSGTAPEIASPSSDVLRIDIVESAAQAEAHYQAIVARYQGDERAVAWVGDCVAAAGDQDADQAQSWEIGCWRAWEERQSPQP